MSDEPIHVAYRGMTTTFCGKPMVDRPPAIDPPSGERPICAKCRRLILEDLAPENDESPPPR